jgi:diadenosine tetraphosphate (Ap4A) HIT family hydrolase
MNDLRPSECVFCALPPSRVIDTNTHALTIADAFPVSPGHTLLVVRRHVANLFDLTREELAAVYELLLSTKIRLDETLTPAGYNIGVNIGENAGQTIGHVHVHLIPRFLGDVAEPRGGVRNVIPGKGPYTQQQ